MLRNHLLAGASHRACHARRLAGRSMDAEKLSQADLRQRHSHKRGHPSHLRRGKSRHAGGSGIVSGTVWAGLDFYDTNITSILYMVSISCGGLADCGFEALCDRGVPLNVIFGVFTGAAVLTIVLVLLIWPRP